jgi:hypothetical protein
MQAIEQLTDPETAALAAEARAFLAAQRWVHQVLDGRVGIAIPGVLGVFQFDLEARPEVPSPLWVVVGDLPSAYLPGDDLPSWEAALDGYVWEMQRWVDAVRAGESVDELIPTGVAPTVEHADVLASRLEFIRQRILAAPDSVGSDT